MCASQRILAAGSSHAASSAVTAPQEFLTGANARGRRAMMFRTLVLCFLFLCCVQGKRRGLRDKIYLPYCRFDQDVIRDDVALNTTIQISDYVFSGKVSSDVTLEDNRTISFYVYAKRFFKNTGSLSARKEVKVTKTLREGEGTKCRQVVGSGTRQFLSEGNRKGRKLMSSSLSVPCP